MSKSPEIIIASAIYPAARPYLGDFFKSIEKASKNHNVRVVLTCENVDDWQQYVSTDTLQITTYNIQSGLSLGKAREALFKCAKTQRSDICIFVDADDMLTSDAIDAYTHSIQTADFVCGNLQLVDEIGQNIECQTLYDEWNISGKIKSSDILLNGNFIGLGAVALTNKCLDSIPDQIPEDIIGVDWWIFYKLLEAGFTGNILKKPTILYRQHGNNVSGIFPTHNLEILKKRIQIALAHFSHIDKTEDVEKRLIGLKRLLTKLDDTNELSIFNPIINKPIPWYSDVIEASLEQKN